MNTRTRYETFSRTRSTWLVLTIAALLWVALCVWAVNSIGFVSSASSRTAEQLVSADTEKRDVEAPADEQAMQALEAEEDEKLQAQAAAAHQRQIAAEEEAAEQARLAAEEEAAEQARLAAEEEAAEQARLAAEEEAAEQARLAAEEEVRLATGDLAVLDGNDSARNTIDEAARQAAAAEASRVAAVARQLRQYENLRERELQVLEDLSSRIRFEPRSATVSRDIERVLDDIFNPLYLYSELPVLISLAGNEYTGTTDDEVLSRDRGRAIASYLINRGLEKDRFRILIEPGENLAYGTHRVSVSAEEVRQ